MTEQELIDTIMGLIDDALIDDPDVQVVWTVKELMNGARRWTLEEVENIARRAIAQCGEGVRTIEAMTDLVSCVLISRNVMEILDAGRLAGEPIAATIADVRRAYPYLPDAVIEHQVFDYRRWAAARAL